MNFNDHFKQFPILETKRLILRNFKYEDITDYLNFFKDEALQKYLGGILIPKDYDDAKRWVDNMNGRCFKGKLVITWGIESKVDHQVIGRLDLGGFVRKSMAEISCYLAKEYWGKGFMAEANNAVLKYGFLELGLHRIQAAILPENERSRKLIHKLGFKQEGLLRKYAYGKEFSDVVMYSILKEEYLNQVKDTQLLTEGATIDDQHNGKPR